MEINITNEVESNFELVETKLKILDDDVVGTNIPETGIKHLNYLRYLEICWANHYNAVISPDYVWQIILCELATHIKNNSEEYRELFTDSDEKKEISVMTSDPVKLPIDSVVDELIKLVPYKPELFVPKFSTTNELASLAFGAAFCDAMSPYYNYMMFCCNIPKIKVEGTTEDWQLIIDSLNSLSEKLNIDEYVNNIEEVISNIIDSYDNPDTDYYEQIFKLERCGSGSQYTVDGWITKLYMEKVRFGLTSNYPSCVSDVSYTNLTTDKKYTMKVGLFSSSFDGDFLVPEFGYVINEQ